MSTSRRKSQQLKRRGSVGALRARALLKKLTPFDDWIASENPTERQIELRDYVIENLKAVASGHERNTLSQYHKNPASPQCGKRHAAAGEN